ncbi:MAG TPA: metallophosphoesterase family protein [Thermoanaerobaculia bacterium]|nr:metallophosphoesterase family protein [Thermoanaerobaculia bacterium]
MRIALMADVHANREALEACLVHAGAHGVDRCIFLGDYVGYGADPEWVVEKIMEHVSRGGLALLGNHDAAVANHRETFEAPAQNAIEWTRGQLGPEHRAFLSGLRLTWEEEGRLYVHADAAAPQRWTYVNQGSDATRSMRATSCRTTFVGHVHKPAIYSMSEMWNSTSDMWKVVAFRPVPGVPVPLLSQRRWLAVLGSVGQPRDGVPAASYAVFDPGRSEITYYRVPYDVEAAAAKIRGAGLSEVLADRLRSGR